MPKWLKRGRVLYCWIDDLKDSRRAKGKWKFCILVGIDSERDELKLVLINSHFSNEFAKTRDGYTEAQFPLRQSDYV